MSRRSTMLIGTLKQVGWGFIVLTPNVHILLPEGMTTTTDLARSERLRVTAHDREGHWVAEKIEPYPT